MTLTRGEPASLTAPDVPGGGAPVSVVDAAGRAAYGCYDGPVRLNAEAFRLRNLFGRELGPFRRRMALGGFAFLGLASEETLVGLAAVRLGYAAQVFGYCFDFATGRLHDRSLRLLPSRVAFPLEPDAHTIRYEGGRDFLRMDKSLAEGRLSVEARLGGLEVSARIPFGLDHHPLRVVNPSCGDPCRFTFTEKAAPLRPEHLLVRVHGEARMTDPGRVFALSDWTAGYFARHTHWLWSAFAGPSTGGVPVGASFAALANESCYPENAFWIGGARTRVARVLFECDPEEPTTRPWRVFTEDGQVDLVFTPRGGRAEQRRLPFVKVNHRQVLGTYSGTLLGADGVRARIDTLPGLAERHLSVW